MFQTPVEPRSLMPMPRAWVSRSDQTAGTVYSAPLSNIPPAASAWSITAKLPVPDQICLGPNGSLFSGQFKAAPGSAQAPAIRQIHADGKVTLLATAPEVSKPSGVVFDPEGQRLFAADAGIQRTCVHVLAVH